jgi:hypothetical protein
MRLRMAIALAAGLLAVSAAQAQAVVTRVVSNTGTFCVKPSPNVPANQFTAIQPAVTASNANDRVVVCNGTYPEQVVIDNSGHSRDGIDVLANTVHGATILAPSTTLSSPEALVYINGTSNAHVRRFRIAGPGPGTGYSFWGVLVENQANKVAATVRDNIIADIREDSPGCPTCQPGTAVAVGRFLFPTAATGRANVIHNEIVRYNRFGVAVESTGSYAQVSTNTITGSGGAIDGPGSVGVSVQDRAGAYVSGNAISENRPAADPNGGYGIVVARTAVPSTYKGNTVFNNDIGIFLVSNGPDGELSNQLVAFNRVFSNGDLSTPAPDAGIVIEDVGPSSPAVGNKFNRNDARTNVGNDCEDDTSGTGTAGTGNTWTFNRGNDAFPSAICTP